MGAYILHFCALRLPTSPFLYCYLALGASFVFLMCDISGTKMFFEGLSSVDGVFGYLVSAISVGYVRASGISSRHFRLRRYLKVVHDLLHQISVIAVQKNTSAAFRYTVMLYASV